MKKIINLTTLLVLLSTAAFAQSPNPDHNPNTYISRWKPNEYIMAQNGVAKIGVPPSPTDISVQWDFIDIIVNDTLSYITIQSKANNKLLLNIEKGKVELSEIPTAFWSGHWFLETIEENGNVWFRLKNRWQGTYLNIENGVLECTAVPAAFWSSHWEMR